MFMLVGLVVALCRVDAVSQSDRTGPFEVQIAIDENSLKADFYKLDGGFYVNTKVRNVDGRRQEIVAWTQFGWSWISSNPAISPGTEAAQNIATRVALQPGQEYVRSVELFSRRRAAKPVTFRLRFFPQVDRPMSDQPEATWRAAGYWSNSVTLP